MTNETQCSQFTTVELLLKHWETIDRTSQSKQRPARTRAKTRLGRSDESLLGGEGEDVEVDVGSLLLLPARLVLPARRSRFLQVDQCHCNGWRVLLPILFNKLLKNIMNESWSKYHKYYKYYKWLESWNHDPGLKNLEAHLTLEFSRTVGCWSLKSHCFVID